jgi:hypothetical protein
MTVRLEVKVVVRNGRVADAIELATRVVARVVAMGGPQGQIFTDSVSETVGGGMRGYWDFANFAALGAFEDQASTDAEYIALGNEVYDPNGPLQTPFERRVFTSVP